MPKRGGRCQKGTITVTMRRIYANLIYFLFTKDTEV